MSIYQDVTVIGGGGGGPFQAVGATNGKLVEKIGVWTGPWMIKAIKLWLTQSDPVMFGDPSGADAPYPYKEFTFNPGERITRLSLWGNGAGTRAGWIYFETSQGRSFDHGMTQWGRKQEYPIDVGSGICVGLTGRCGADIDCLGFVFLKPIRSSLLRDVTYPTLAFDAMGITPETLDVFSEQNTTNAPRKWSFSGKRIATETSSWSVKVGLELHCDVSVQAGIPEVAKVDMKFGWKVSTSSTHTNTETNSHQLTWAQAGTLQAGDAIYLQALTRRGAISLPYTATLEVVLQSGETFAYPVQGVYTGLTYTGVEISDIAPAKLDAYRAACLTAEPEPTVLTLLTEPSSPDTPVPVEPAMVPAGATT